MGGSGGGGGSGEVDYPFEMKAALYNWLFGKSSDGLMDDELTVSVTEALNSAFSNSSYASAVAYEPDDNLEAMDTSIGALATSVVELNHLTSYSDAHGVVAGLYVTGTATHYTATLDTASFDSDRHDADIAAYSELLDDEIDNVQLPKFKAGMLNIGAVNSSAFTIGEALIRAFKGRDLIKYGTGLRTEVMKQVDEHNARFKISRREIQKDYDVTYGNQSLQFRVERERLMHAAVTSVLTQLVKKIELQKDAVTLTVEKNRLHIIAKQEATDKQLEYDEADARWYLESFQYGANVMASIGGGTATRNAKKPSMAASALGGAIAGAAAGTAVYPGIGTAVGAVLGAAAGALGSS